MGNLGLESPATIGSWNLKRKYLIHIPQILKTSSGYKKRFKRFFDSSTIAKIAFHIQCLSRIIKLRQNWAYTFHLKFVSSVFIKCHFSWKKFINYIAQKFLLVSKTLRRTDAFVRTIKFAWISTITVIVVIKINNIYSKV